MMQVQEEKKKGIMDRIREMFRRESYVKYGLEDLGINVAKITSIDNRLSSLENMIDQIHKTQDVDELEVMIDKLIHLAAVAWLRAGSQYQSSRLLIAYEKLKRDMKFIVSNDKNAMMRIYRQHLLPYVYIVINASFKNEDVAQQFVAVLQKQEVVAGQ
ncbi:MAG: hypothetical protein ACP5IZ_11990 [Thermoprotei archaeon]